MSDDLEGILADPARLLSTGRAVVREGLADGRLARTVGGEVFLQAEAIFGDAPVPRSEFASWLHFAATATGHAEYAGATAAAEPRMPWRTVWAWWRPANWFLAQPSLNGDYFQVRRCLYEGRELVAVTDQRGLVGLDARTGRRVAVGDEKTLTDAPYPVDAAEAPELWQGDLSVPEEWADAEAFAVEGGRTRYLVQSVHGVAVVETDAEALRDRPDGDGPASGEEAGAAVAPPARRPTGSLTSARVEDAFGAGNVVRFSESDLPEALVHAGSRRYLREIGLPTWWASHGGEYTTRAADDWLPPADGALPTAGLPDGTSAADLITFGDCTYGELYLHRQDGTVHLWSGIEGRTRNTLVPLAPGLDVFTRVLEAVHRYANACWHPYPVEGDQEDVSGLFRAELNDLAPGLGDDATPAGTVWSWLCAGITELGVDGF